MRIIVRFDELLNGLLLACMGDDDDVVVSFVVACWFVDWLSGGSDVIEIDEFDTAGDIDTDADDGSVEIEFKSMFIGFI